MTRTMSWLTFNRILRAVAVAVAFTLASVSGAGVAVAGPPAPGPTAAATAPSRAIPGARVARPATAAEIAAYRERDKKASQKLGEFAGGDVVVITASTLAIVLLIVLLVVLIR